MTFEWIAEKLNKEKFNIHFILLKSGDSELEKWLIENKFPVERITYRGKKDLPKAIISTYKILKKTKPTIVHTHLFEANLVGLIAAKMLGIPKRIHTRHHSNYHHVYYPNAVKYDKLANYLSTDIIAVTKVVNDILIEKENVPPQKVRIIHHGFRFDEFQNVTENAINKIREKYNKQASTPVIGVISRYVEWKGIQYIIPAFAKFIEKYPDALLVLANSKGEYSSQVKGLLQQLPTKNYIEIEFEENIFALYKLFDIFIHVPISPELEAFGQTYVEALAAGIPSVFTLSGIANSGL